MFSGTFLVPVRVTAGTKHFDLREEYCVIVERLSGGRCSNDPFAPQIQQIPDSDVALAIQRMDKITIHRCEATGGMGDF
jgi:hypothetical protein